MIGFSIEGGQVWASTSIIQSWTDCVFRDVASTYVLVCFGTPGLSPTIMLWFRFCRFANITSSWFVYATGRVSVRFRDCLSDGSTQPTEGGSVVVEDAESLTFSLPSAYDVCPVCVAT